MLDNAAHVADQLVDQREAKPLPVLLAGDEGIEQMLGDPQMNNSSCFGDSGGPVFARLPDGSRAVELADGRTSTYFLTTFGRAKRESVCSCEVKMEPTLSQALHLMNGDAVNDRIKQGRVVAKMIQEKKSDREIVEDLFLRVFGRMPVEKEWTAVQQAIANAPDARQAALEDLFWALLNSKEFFFNH